MRLTIEPGQLRYDTGSEPRAVLQTSTDLCDWTDQETLEGAGTIPIERQCPRRFWRLRTENHPEKG